MKITSVNVYPTARLGENVKAVARVTIDNEIELRCTLAEEKGGELVIGRARDTASEFITGDEPKYAYGFVSQSLADDVRFAVIMKYKELFQ